jgi:hypothetical protein
MTMPYIPTAFATPVFNPAIGSIGSPPIPYLSLSQYNFIPTGMGLTNLVPGNVGAQQTEALADEIADATAWANEIVFGYDPSSDGASLAASLIVEGANVKMKPGGTLNLICDYKPIIQVVGVDVGPNPSSLTSVGQSVASAITIGRRTIVVPLCGVPSRSNDSPPPFLPTGALWPGTGYATWSYVAGYPHTQLAASVAASATSCVVEATNGSGGLWGVFPASGAFPGTQLAIRDRQYSESVYVTAVTANDPSPGLGTLTTTAFANAHTVPSAPDFLPVTAIPRNVVRAVSFLVTCLIKTRGVRTMTMAGTAGGKPNGKAMGQAGCMDDYEHACRILRRYAVRVKSKV